jgi:hypothetical protein
MGDGESFLSSSLSALEHDRLLILRPFSDENTFRSFVQTYDYEMLHAANHSHLGDRFLDLSERQSLLRSPVGPHTFVHPFLLAVVSYLLGGPIRLIDGRAKDTGPARSNTRDNGVHLDDTPFGAELKILLLWEKSTTRGPRSQNFVAIAGAQNLKRSVPTEHGSNFKTPREIVDELLCNPSLGDKRPLVIEAEDLDPLTVIFEGSAVPHHRFRTLTQRQIRSTLQLAFHIDDSLERPITHYCVGPQQSNLLRFVLGGIMADSSSEAREQFFLDAIRRSRREILSKASDLSFRNAMVAFSDKQMSRERIVEWLVEIGTIPSLRDVRARVRRYAIRNDDDVRAFLVTAEHDKHHDMDLRLYPDRREIARLRARNRIREMSIEDVLRRQKTLQRLLSLDYVAESDLLSTDQLTSIARNTELALAEMLGQGCEASIALYLASTKQLVHDVADAIARVASIQDLRTESIILYWILDTTWEAAQGTATLPGRLIDEIDLKALALLRHYRALAAFDDACTSIIPMNPDIDRRVIKHELTAKNYFDS